MLHSSRTILLKNKKNAILRNPMPSDAIPMINFQKQCALETPFLLRSPEECEITTILLKNKKNAILRNPMPSDAIPMINFQKQCALETPFLLRSPEECEITKEQQKAAIEAANHSDTQLMLLCIIDKEIAGSCQIIFQKRLKTQHRGKRKILLRCP